MVKSIVFSLVFLTVSSLSEAQSLGDISFGEEGVLEVMTWNVEWFPKDGQTTIDSMSVVIAALDIDVIAFQEIGDTASFRTMIDNIPGFSPHILDAWSGGLAYASRTATIEVLDFYEEYEEEEYWNAFPRTPQVLHFLFEGEEYYLINNHFKCCGDGLLDESDVNDEETRRLEACTLLRDLIDSDLPNDRVIVVGDLNDILEDNEANNVFVPFLNNPEDYEFVDVSIAQGPSTDWSFPNWPSHLDHILITDEMFNQFSDPGSSVHTLKIGDYLDGGFSQYDNIISDHRPVALKLVTDQATHVDNAISSNSIQVWPNPSTNQLYISAPLDLQKQGWSLINLNGVVMMQGQIQSPLTSIDITELAPGIFILFVESTLPRKILVVK
jgi:hypothetical protein